MSVTIMGFCDVGECHCLGVCLIDDLEDFLHMLYGKRIICKYVVRTHCALSRVGCYPALKVSESAVEE